MKHNGTRCNNLVLFTIFFMHCGLYHACGGIFKNRPHISISWIVVPEFPFLCVAPLPLPLLFSSNIFFRLLDRCFSLLILLLSMQVHIRILESTQENISALLVGLEYLINISYVDDTEVFKVWWFWHMFLDPSVYFLCYECSNIDIHSCLLPGRAFFSPAPHASWPSVLLHK